MRVYDEYARLLEMRMTRVQITLSTDEALVLFEWLASREDAADKSAPLSAEDVALGRVHGQLEAQLDEPFDPNYRALVKAARARLAPS